MEIPASNQPFSEQFRLAAEDWVEKEAAASLLEDSKSSVMAQRQAALGEMAVNKAEQIVKASPEWVEYVEQTVEARKQANFAKVKMEWCRMRFQQEMSEQANSRAEARLVA